MSSAVQRCKGTRLASFVQPILELVRSGGLMIAVQVAEGAGALAALAAEWEELIGNSFASIFCHPYWYQAYLHGFSVGKVAIITAREHSRLVGVLPVARLRADAGGLYFRQIMPFARGDYQPPIVTPERAAAALPRMLDAALQYFGRGAFYWPNIPASDAALNALRDFFHSRRMACTEARDVSPRLCVGGRDFHSIERTWTASHRNDIRRQQKRLSQRGAVALWQPETLDQAEGVLAEFFRVHDEKWLAQGFPGMFHLPCRQRQFRALLRGFWNRGLHFSTLRCGETDVSYNFGFLAGGWLHWYRPSFRSEFGAYSPGKLHLALLVEEACRQRWHGIDFLLGQEHYKSLWANESLEVVSLNAALHSWTPSHLWFSRGKRFVKSRPGVRTMQESILHAQAWLQKRRFRFRPTNERKT